MQITIHHFSPSSHLHTSATSSCGSKCSQSYTRLSHNCHRTRSLSRRTDDPKLEMGAEDLEGWQVNELRQAAAGGRKKVEIQQLCKQTGLGRREVLHWLKHADELPSHFPSTSERLHQSTGRRNEKFPSGDGRGTGREAQAPPPGGTAAKPGKRLSRSVLATLESVLESSISPKEEVVLSIVDLHNIPRKTVLEWFKERRAERKNQQSPH